MSTTNLFGEHQPHSRFGGPGEELELSQFARTAVAVQDLLFFLFLTDEKARFLCIGPLSPPLNPNTLGSMLVKFLQTLGETEGETSDISGPCGARGLERNRGRWEVLAFMAFIVDSKKSDLVVGVPMSRLVYIKSF